MLQVEFLVECFNRHQFSSSKTLIVCKAMAIDRILTFYIFTVSSSKTSIVRKTTDNVAFLSVFIFDHVCLQKLQSFARLWLLTKFWPSTFLPSLFSKTSIVCKTMDNVGFFRCLYLWPCLSSKTSIVCKTMANEGFLIFIFDHFCLQKLQSFARLWLTKHFWSRLFDSLSFDHLCLQTLQ